MGKWKEFAPGILTLLTLLAGGVLLIRALVKADAVDNDRRSRARDRYCEARLAAAHTAADTVAVYDDTSARYRCEFAEEVPVE